MKPLALLVHAAVSVAATCCAWAQSNTVVGIGDRRQVFIDGGFFAASTNVELVAHHPRKTGEQTLVADRPWERGGLGPYSSVLKDGDVYRMWYHAMDAKLWD